MKHKYETNVQKTLDCRQNKCSLQIFNTHIFQILSVTFAIPFLCRFQKRQFLVEKKLNNFLRQCNSIFMSSKNIFHTGDINIFALRSFFFSRYVQLKSFFCDEQKISAEIGDTRQQRSYRKLTWQTIKGKFHQWLRLELCKVVHNAKLH